MRPMPQTVCNIVIMKFVAQEAVLGSAAKMAQAGAKPR